VPMTLRKQLSAQQEHAVHIRQRGRQGFRLVEIPRDWTCPQN
jgi:hypothetical protein